MFGVLTAGAGGEPLLGYLREPRPVSAELLALAGPVAPTEIFRFSAPCAGSACQHFDGRNCRLVSKVVQAVPAVVEKLPPCRIRRTCRWWQQEGGAACRRCPLIVTESDHASDDLRRAADPAFLPAPLDADGPGDVS